MKSFNHANKLKNIDGNYFVRMMLPDAERMAEEYVKEESVQLLRLASSINTLNEMNFIVVGAGTLWYIDLVWDKIKTYIAIEPQAEIFLHKQINFLIRQHKNIRVIRKEMGKFNVDEIPEGNSLFVFHFNILAYISNPIRNINKYLKKGDVLYISSWSKTIKAKKIRTDYFSYINADQKGDIRRIDPTDADGVCNLDDFPFKSLTHYKSHVRISGEITDILIIYC